MSFDKYRTCKDCPDRVVGCHADCEGYQFRHNENMERLRKEQESKWKPTAHDEQAWLDFYKRQKKNYKMYRR